MKTVETIAKVSPAGRLTVQMPARVRPGEYRVVVVIEEKTVNSAQEQLPIPLPILHVGQWPQDMSLRRVDFYGEDGR